MCGKASAEETEIELCWTSVPWEPLLGLFDTSPKNKSQNKKKKNKQKKNKAGLDGELAVEEEQAPSIIMKYSYVFLLLFVGMPVISFILAMFW